MPRNHLIALAFLCIPFSATAALPELRHLIAADKPVGTAHMQVMWMDVYTASFWSDSGGWEKPPYALTLTYGMRFTAEELASRTRQEMLAVSSLPAAICEEYAERLKKIWPNVNAGDRITALADKDSTLFFYNGKKLGTIEGQEFMKAFFAIWLSAKSSEPAMRQQLLAK